MKKLILTMLFSLVFVGSAFAELTEIDGYLVDVPTGWTISRTNNGAVLVASPDSASSVRIMSSTNPQGQTAQQIAESATASRGGGAPKSEGEGYIFDAPTNGGGPATWYYVTTQSMILEMRMLGNINEELLAVAKSVRLK